MVKSEKKEAHLQHLAQTFAILLRLNMKLNLKKCNFEVESRKFLSHMVIQRGIEANPSKIKANMDMGTLRSVKEVQRLTLCLTALNRFIYQMGDKCKPLFDTLKKGKFQWIDES